MSAKEISLRIEDEELDLTVRLKYIQISLKNLINKKTSLQFLKLHRPMQFNSYGFDDNDFSLFFDEDDDW